MPAFRSSMTVLLACWALALSGTRPIAAAQDAKAPAVLPAPSAGKAIVCLYRVTRVTGSGSHDYLYVNGAFLANLLSGEYAFTEVSPGTVIVSGLPQLTYGGAVYSTAAALNDATKKENERTRLEAESGKTYYLKWTAGPMATGISVTLQDPSTGAKEMSKLHLSKPPKDKGNQGATRTEAPSSDRPVTRDTRE